MTQDLLREVCEELKHMDMDFIVVGGSALVNEGYDISTSDLDFVLTPKHFDEIEKKLEESSRFSVKDRIQTMIESEFMFENSWRTVEFIDPDYFSGDKPPDGFIDYVKRYRSVKKDIGYVAKPEVVFYMRLMVADWEIYIQKILRDVRSGLPISLLDEVSRISKTLKVEDKMEPRVKKTKEIIESRIESRG